MMIDIECVKSLNSLPTPLATCSQPFGTGLAPARGHLYLGTLVNKSLKKTKLLTQTLKVL